MSTLTNEQIAKLTRECSGATTACLLILIMGMGVVGWGVMTIQNKIDEFDRKGAGDQPSRRPDAPPSAPPSAPPARLTLQDECDIIREGRAFVNRTLRLPAEHDDPPPANCARTVHFRKRAAQRNLISVTIADKTDIRGDLAALSGSPQPDGSFVHLTSWTHELAGFWLDGQIRAVYSGMKRTVPTPVLVPDEVLARLADPARAYALLVKMGVVRLPVGDEDMQ